MFLLFFGMRKAEEMERKIVVAQDFQQCFLAVLDYTRRSRLHAFNRKSR